MIYDLILDMGLGIDPFIIGDSINEHIAVLDFEFNDGAEGSGWNSYSFFDGNIEVYVDPQTRIIESVAGTKKIMYDSENLIGMQFSAFLKTFSLEKELLQVSTEWLIDDERQLVYEVPDPEMQVWVNTEDVVTALYLG